MYNNRLLLTLDGYDDPVIGQPVLSQAVKVLLQNDAGEDSTGPSSFLLNGLLVLPVFGFLARNTMAGCDYNTLTAYLMAAQANPIVSAVLLYINSGGGEAVGCKETADLIAEVNKTKPVFAYTDGLCCSGAYWLASQTSAILTSESAQVGSIGCIKVVVDVSEQNKREGVKVYTFKSGEFKDIGNPTRPLAEAEIAFIQSSVDDTGRKFLNAVAVRKIAPEYVSGLYFSGDVAVTSNLADGLVADVFTAISSICSIIGEQKDTY